MWEGSGTVPAPTTYGLHLVRVPAGSPLKLDIRLESVLDGVLVTAVVTAALTGECARCLDEVTDTLEVELVELWSYPEQAERYARTSGSGPDQDEEVRQLDGDVLDLEPALRDAIVVALPPSPLCRVDCGGLCVECGARLDEVGPNHRHEQIDPRWANLRGLQDGGDHKVATAEYADEMKD
jgi:uncharacterized protein